MNRLALYTSALIGLGVISQASADNVIKMTGSTAFRSNVHNTLVNNTGAPAGVFDAGTVTWATYGNSTASSGTYALYHGNIGGVGTYIDVFWSGSEAGIAAVANVSGATLNDGGPLAGVPVTFLKTDGTVTLSAAGTVNTALPPSGAIESSSSQPDLAFADTSQAVSLTPPVGANKLTDYGICGIIPFTWCKGYVNKSDAAWGRLSNLSTAQVNLLLGAPQTADLFNSGVTGGGADFDHTVYLMGRNKGSGTRVNQLIAAQYPVGNPVTQWSVSSTIGTSAAGLFGLYYNPSDPAYNGNYVLTAIPHTAGDINDADNGYESGGDVAKALGGNSGLAGPATGYNGPFDNQPALTVGFLGIGDASKMGASLTASLPFWLNYNGVFESDGGIENGTYLAYGHEHVFGKNTPSNPAATALVRPMFIAIKKLLHNNDAVAGGTYDNSAADPATLHSGGILGAYMFADKQGQVDTGYPVPGAAVGKYTGDVAGTGGSSIAATPASAPFN